MGKRPPEDPASPKFGSELNPKFFEIDAIQLKNHLEAFIAAKNLSADDTILERSILVAHDGPFFTLGSMIRQLKMEGEGSYFKVVASSEGVGQIEPDIGALSRVIHLNPASDILAAIVQRFEVEDQGIPTDEFPLTRFVPFSIYLSDEEDLPAVLGAVENILNDVDLEIAVRRPAEYGSVFQRFTARTKDVVTSDAVTERVAKVERALELQGLGKPQAAIDRDELEGMAALITALDNTDEAVFRFGSTVLIKLTAADGTKRMVGRNLTTAELIALEHDPVLAKSPYALAAELGLNIGGPVASGAIDGGDTARTAFDAPGE